MARESFSRYQSYTAQVENRRRFFRILKNLILVFVIYGILQTVFLRSLQVENDSMAPQLNQGDRVLSTPLLTGPRVPIFGWVLPGIAQPQRGDLVEVRPRSHKPSPFWITAPDEILRFFTLNMVSMEKNLRPNWDQSSVLRRIVGLPGDKVQVRDNVAYVLPPGETSHLSEYELSVQRYDLVKNALPAGWLAGDPQSADSQEVLLGPDEYFVLGDNRSGASDSRHWGVVKRSDLIGLVFLQYWPLGEFGTP